MPKKPHPVDIHEREQMARASSYAIYFRRGPDFSIREEGFASLLAAIIRAEDIERAHPVGRLCLIYAVTPEGRAFLISTDMRINERNKS